jgi:methylmalonyl-CoA mutase, N-terminal domain
VIEHLTDEITRQAQAYLQKIDDLGGALAAIRAGCGRRQPVPDQEALQLERLKVDPAIEQEQVARLTALREERDAVKAAEMLAHLEQAARGSENLMPVLVACVENDLTLGEICGLLRKTWGEYHSPAWI